MKNILSNIRVLMHNNIIWDYLFNNRRTRLVLVAIYLAMEKKFCNQHSLYPDVASAGFLKKCEIQKVHKHLFSNKVDIWLMRPDLMIGKVWCDIDWIQEYTGYKIKLHESKHYANPVQEIVSNIGYIACNFQEEQK